MNKSRIERVVRYLLVTMLAIFGANIFLHFMPQPTPPEEGGRFLGALGGAGYVFPTIGVVFLLAALLLVARRVVLALLLVAPIALNILLYHFKFDLSGIGPGGLLSALLLVLAAIHAKEIAVLFQSSKSPNMTERPQAQSR